MKKAKHVPSMTITTLDEHPPFVASHIKWYTRNLLKTKKLNHELLELAIEGCDESTRQTLCQEAVIYDSENNFCGNQRRLREIDADDVAKLLMNKWSESETKWTRAEIAKKLIGALGRARRTSSKDLDDLCRAFQLNSDEKSIITFLFCATTYEPLENYTDNMRLPALLCTISKATAIPQSRIRISLSRKEKLRRSGLISKVDQGRNGIDLNEDIQNHLCGISGMEFVDSFFRKDDQNRYSSKSCNVPSDVRRIIAALLASAERCNILLYGTPGTGKTEFARAVAAECGANVYFVNHGLMDECRDGKPQSARTALTVATNCLSNSSNVLIVDEADSLLNTRYRFIFGDQQSPDKAWINEFLDQDNHRIIWIANDVSCIEESTLRRFSYSASFRQPPIRTREATWQRLLDGQPFSRFITPAIIRELSSRYPISTGGIASALSVLDSVCAANDDKKTVQSTLRELVRRHASATGVTAKTVAPLPDAYDLSALNTSTEIQSLVATLQRVSRESPSDSWDGAAGGTLLFWGAPGTGKSAFAGYLSEQVGRDLVIERASDLLSCWVGGTEKNVAQAFARASKSGSLLLIDEADSLFVDRKSAHRSWEVSRTNELLTQMENFEGILICCTNMLDKLDSAVLRRFIWKIEFRELTPEARVQLCRRYFPRIKKWKRDALQELRRMKGLTAGDIKVACRQLRFHAPDSLDPETVLSVLRKEVCYKCMRTKPIGFSEQ